MAHALAEFTERVLLPFVPEHGLAKYQAKRHFISQRLKRGTSAPRARKMDVRPGREVAAPLPAVVPLHPVPQRVPAKGTIIQHDLAREHRIGMRRARKTEPSLAAQLRAKGRSVSQIPADSLPANLDAPAAFVLASPVLANPQAKRTRTTLAQSRVVRTHALQIRAVQISVVRTKTLGWKSLDPRLRFSLFRKPRRPDLHRLPLRIVRAPAPPRIHQQIPEQPSPAPIAQSHPQKPNPITPPHQDLGEQPVQRLHTPARITPVRPAQT